MKHFLARLLTVAVLLFHSLVQAVYSDNAGRMAMATGGQSASYSYYADQLRASKTVNGVVTRYHYGPAGSLLVETDGATGAVLREYVWDDEVPVAQASAGPIVYLRTDHLGTPRLGTDSVGAEVWRWDSDAFGTTAPTGSAVVNLAPPWPVLRRRDWAAVRLTNRHKCRILRSVD